MIGLERKELIYQKVKNSIKGKILNGELARGQMLPSEKDYCAEFSTSRMTVRQALQDLQNEGFIYSIKGKGSFVSQPKVDQYLSKLTSFSQDMRNRNMVPGGRVLSVKKISASLELANSLKVQAGHPLYTIKRLRTANELAMAIETSYLNLEITGDLSDIDFNNISLYEYLKNERGINISKAIQSFETMLVTGKDAQYLDAENNSPALLMKRTTFVESGQVMEYVESIYIGSRYKFYVDLYI